MTHKRGSHRTDALGIQLGLIVTPMLDMAFQILAFFIMTYHPSALEAHIPGSLTPGEPPIQGKADVDAPLADSVLPDELQDALTVKVKAVVKGQAAGNRVEGEPSQILLKFPLEVAPRLIADVDLDFHVALKQLDAQLKEFAKNGAASKTHLKIAAEGELRQQYVIAVYDVARKAGFEKIHFVPPPVLNSKLK